MAIEVEFRPESVGTVPLVGDCMRCGSRLRTTPEEGNVVWLAVAVGTYRWAADCPACGTTCILLPEAVVSRTTGASGVQ